MRKQHARLAKGPEVEILVSQKDKQKLEMRREMIADVDKELEDYRRLIENVIGKNEEAKMEGPGETVGGVTSLCYSDDSQEYLDDFDDIMEDMAIDQAEIEEDRDDDPELADYSTNASSQSE